MELAGSMVMADGGDHGSPDYQFGGHGLPLGAGDDRCHHTPGRGTEIQSAVLSLRQLANIILICLVICDQLPDQMPLNC